MRAPGLKSNQEAPWRDGGSVRAPPQQTRPNCRPRHCLASAAPKPSDQMAKLDAAADAAMAKLNAMMEAEEENNPAPPLASEGRRPSSPSEPIDPLAIRRIQSKPFDPAASDVATEAESRFEYQAPKGKGEPTIWVNRQAAVTLLRAGAWPVHAERHGMTFEEAHTRAVIAGLQAMAEEPGPGRNTLRHFARILSRAANLDAEPRAIAIVQAGPEMSREESLAAQQEEWDHIAGIRLGGGTIEGLLDYHAVRQAAPEEIATAEAALAANGYDEPAHYAHEIFVRLLRGRHAELQLTAEQAGKLTSLCKNTIGNTWRSSRRHRRHPRPSLRTGRRCARSHGRTRRSPITTWRDFYAPAQRARRPIKPS